MRCEFVPVEIFQNMIANGNLRQKEIGFQNLEIAAQLRGMRIAFMHISPLLAVPPGQKRRTIYDAENGMILPGKHVRSESDSKSKDNAVNEAYNGSGNVYDFFSEIYDRNSIDGNGMRLDSTVHYRQNFSNAFWNGNQMVYGDGDGEVFQRMTKSLDVIAHEMTHGVTQFESGLDYTGQPGALNEHFSDVFGVLTKQYVKNQKASEADWLVGAGLFTRAIHGKGIRSLKEPGSAYDDPLIGKDPQPSHMKDYVDTDSDNGGVHINSGIPNKAFYNLAIALGGNAWVKAGKIWYVTLIEKVRPATDFQKCAEMTSEVAGTLFGNKSKEKEAVRTAWSEVGIDIK